jgi:hypothetical protein
VVPFLQRRVARKQQAIHGHGGAQTFTAGAYPKNTMNRVRYLVFGAILAIGSIASAQTTVSTRQSGGSKLTAETFTANTQNQLLGSLTPTSCPILAHNDHTAPAATQSSNALARHDDSVIEVAGIKFATPNLNQNSAESRLPKASSPLPLISVIGFGILVGGIVSAMKTRS